MEGLGWMRGRINGGKWLIGPPPGGSRGEEAGIPCRTSPEPSQLQGPVVERRRTISVVETDHDKLPHWEPSAVGTCELCNVMLSTARISHRVAPEDVLRAYSVPAVRGAWATPMDTERDEPCDSDEMIRPESSRVGCQWCKPRDRAGLCPLCAAAAQLFDPLCVRPPSIGQSQLDGANTGTNAQSMPEALWCNFMQRANVSSRGISWRKAVRYGLGRLKAENHER